MAIALAREQKSPQFLQSKVQELRAPARSRGGPRRGIVTVADPIFSGLWAPIFTNPCTVRAHRKYAGS